MFYFSDLLASMSGYLWAILVVSLVLIVIGIVKRGQSVGLTSLLSGIVLFIITLIAAISLHANS